MGDVLSHREVTELVVVQRGTRPLYPIAQTPLLPDRPFTFRLGEGNRTPSEELERIFAGGPELMVDELEAAQRASVEDGETIYVPIGEGRVVPVPWLIASPSDYEAFHTWMQLLRSAN